MKKFYLVILTTIYLANTAFAGPLEDLLSKIETDIANLKRSSIYPIDYVAYTNLFTEEKNRTSVNTLRQNWIDLAKLKSTTQEISGDSLSRIKILADDLMLQQFALEEIADMALSYESWVKDKINRCTNYAIPLIKGFNLIYSEKRAPFAFAKQDSLLTAIYLAITPPTNSIQFHIHNCLMKSPTVAISVEFLALVNDNKIPQPTPLINKFQISTNGIPEMSIKELTYVVDYQEFTASSRQLYDVYWEGSAFRTSGLETRTFREFTRRASSRKK